ILRWCFANRLRDYPLPDKWQELEDWSDALDEKTTGNRIEPGALLSFCTAEERLEPDQTMAARKAFRRRLVQTPGIVATSEMFVGASLVVSAIETDMVRDIDAAFQRLRGAWET